MEIPLSNLSAWSLQVFVLVIAAGGLPWLFRLHPPAVRHAYWRALLLVCLILPFVQSRRPEPISLPVTSPKLVSTSAAAASKPRNAARTVPIALPDVPGRWAQTAGLLIAAGALVRLCWVAAGLLRLRRLRLIGKRPGADEATDDLFTLLSARADVRYVDDLRQPVTFGLFRPVVLLPSRLDSQPPELRRAVFAHELWHVRRSDWLWVVLEELVRSILWFHPAIAWLVARVQASREEVVDELTVLTTNARRSYLEALLAFADEPRVYPATPFARRRHLFQRMLLISREAVMSSRRIVSSCAAMCGMVVAAGWYGATAFPLTAATPPAGQSQPRDIRPGEARPASSREQQLRSTLAAGSAPLASYLEVAQLQEARGATSETETTLNMARAAFPTEPIVLMSLAQLYQRAGRADDAVSAAEQYAALKPSDPQAQHLAATFYEELERRGAATISAADRRRYAQAGVAAEDRALGLKPDYVDAMIVKNILLRHQANLETSATAQAQLIAEADQLRNRAIELQQGQRQLMGSGGAGVSVGMRNNGMPPPPPPPPPPQPRGAAPPPPPPPPGGMELVDGMAPVRVGGNIKQPTKVRNVLPVYPPIAQQAGVQGVVILEAIIDSTGSVHEAKVLRSIPLLDQAAIEAVQQWQFTPTVVNGQAVPVVMTVTVNFTLGG